MAAVPQPRSKPAPFVPPQFGNIGKTVNDLFKKKFDYDHTLKVINRSTAGLTVESGAVQASTTGTLRGYTKTTYTPPEKWGKVDAELHTDPTQINKISALFNRMAPGVALTFSAASRDKDGSFKKPHVITAEAEYTTDYFSSKLTAKSDTEVHKADVQASVGYDNVALGASAAISGQGQLQETNFGAEYITPARDLVASLYTEKNAGIVNGAFLQRVSRDQSVGAIFKQELNGKQARSLAIGTEYRLDADTEIKAKLELPTGLVSSVIQHQLRNPRVLLSLAASFKTGDRALTADRFGLTATLGDF